MKPVKKNKSSGKSKSKRSEFDKWMRRLKRQYNVVSIKPSGPPGEAYGATLIQYQRPIPQRIPIPRGPLSGAELSTVQLVTAFNTSTNVSSGVIAQSGSTALFGSIAFRLDDCDQVSTFSSMFDQYRIERVHLRIRARNNAVFTASIASPNQAVPNMFVVADFDDSTAPTLLSDLRQYPNCIELNTSDNCDIILRPSLTPSVFASGAFSGYTLRGPQWIDIANTSVPHYGVKFGVTALQVSSTYVWGWDVEAWYVLSFRSVR